ncbi:hypothetical protein ACHAXT_012351 [Thalassiosira profunda]
MQRLALVAFVLFAPPSGVHALNVAPTSGVLRKTPLSFAPLSTHPEQADGLSRSRLFGRGASRSALRSSAPNDSDAVDAEIAESSATKSSTSFLRAVDNFGMKLKPWALSAYGRSKASDINGQAKGGAIGRILWRVQANVLWMMYIIYRAYRGFFVILPAVFKEVYRQLEDSDLAFDVYGDEEEEEREYAVNANAEDQPPQPPMKLRTRITISFLSVMLTASYVVSGALRVLGKFLKTFTSTTSVESSFEAAADEVDVNEDKLRNNLK